MIDYKTNDCNWIFYLNKQVDWTFSPKRIDLGFVPEQSPVADACRIVRFGIVL